MERRIERTGLSRQAKTLVALLQHGVLTEEELIKMLSFTRASDLNALVDEIKASGINIKVSDNKYRIASVNNTYEIR